MKKKTVSITLVFCLSLMFAGVSSANTIKSVKDNEPIIIFSEADSAKATANLDMDIAETGSLSTGNTRGLGDIVTDLHDLDMHRIFGYVEAEAGTQVVNGNLQAEIWEMTVYGTLYKNGLYFAGLPSTSFTGPFGIATTSRTDNNPNKGDFYLLNTRHNVTNVGTGAEVWCTTHGLSGTY